MRLLPFIGLIILLLSACEPAPETMRFSGQTMGTTYNIVAITSDDIDKGDLQAAITTSLGRVNKHLSNWDKTSEISRFNNLTTTEPVKISPMFAKVMESAILVHKKSEGFFDITISPLVDLWGFGPHTDEKQIPEEDQIRQALSKIGQATHLKLDEQANTLAKLTPEVQLNLSAIAKGFGVDEVANTLLEFGITHFMVEIGGDLIVRGLNPRGEKWRIGIEKPDEQGKQVQLVAKLSDLGMATSGDYRNYFEKNSQRYSHILNVKTGRPVTHQTVSVTVLAKNAMLADAWATALLALGKTKGMEIAQKNNLAALFIIKSGDAASPSFETVMSRRFKQLQTEK